MVREVLRKERSDKKREVKPLVPVSVREAIFRISHITHTPIKDVAEFLVEHLSRDKKTISELSNHFKRSIAIDNTYYMGDITRHGIAKRLNGETGLVSIKFKKPTYEVISALAYALDVTPTRATAILLTDATRNIKAVNAYIHEYLVDELTEGQMKELRKVLSYVNKYDDEQVSWMHILAAVVGNVRPATKTLREIVEDYLKDKV